METMKTLHAYASNLDHVVDWISHFQSEDFPYDAMKLYVVDNHAGNMAAIEANAIRRYIGEPKGLQLVGDPDGSKFAAGIRKDESYEGELSNVYEFVTETDCEAFIVKRNLMK